MLSTQRDDQLLVGLLLARLVQHAHVGLAPVESLTRFAEATGEAVVDEGDLEDSLQGVEDGHAAGLAGAVGGDLDLVGRGDLLIGSGGGLFSVRLGSALVWVVLEMAAVMQRSAHVRHFEVVSCSLRVLTRRASSAVGRSYHGECFGAVGDPRMNLFFGRRRRRRVSLSLYGSITSRKVRNWRFGARSLAGGTSRRLCRASRPSTSPHSTSSLQLIFQ